MRPCYLHIAQQAIEKQKNAKKFSDNNKEEKEERPRKRRGKLEEVSHWLLQRGKEMGNYRIQTK